MPPVKSGLTQRGVDNNDARWAALNSVSQTPADLAAAQGARSQAARPLYDAAHQSFGTVDQSLLNVAQRPAVQQAMQAADTLAKNEGVQLTWPTPQNPQISGRAVDYTTRALGDMIDAAKRAGNSQQARALTDSLNQINTWGSANIPGLDKAAQTYAQMSVPVNTMEAGQQIAGSLGTRAMNAGGVPEIQLNPYRAALVKALNDSEYGIDPAAHSTLQGIGQDLQRATVSNSIRTPGSDTAYNLAANGWLAKQLYGPGFEGMTGLGKTAAAAGTALAGHPYAGAAIYAGGNKLGQAVGTRLQSQLADLLLNPDAILPYLDAHAASSAQSVPKPLVRALLNYGRPAAVNGLLGGVVNRPNE